MTQLEHKPLRDLVADEIRRLIVTGEIAAGERLVEDKLAERLGVSRNPVREAIRSLEPTGIVEVIPRKGAYATSVGVDAVRELQEIRSVIESWVVTEAAKRATDDDIAEIERCIEAGIKYSRDGDAVRAAEMHRAFHLAIERASHNSYVSLALAPLRQRTELVFSLLFDYRDEGAWDEHKAIRDAIADGDDALARRLIIEHIDNAIGDYERTTT
jgi:DNA-binding GntR family transcriptional regulator